MYRVADFLIQAHAIKTLILSCWDHIREGIEKLYIPLKVIVLGAIAREFVGEKLHVPDEKIEIVAKGVPAITSPRGKFDDTRRFELLLLGKLIERKGVLDYLLAIKQMTSLRNRNFLPRLAGGGDVEYYKKFVSQNQLENADYIPTYIGLTFP